LSLQIRIGINTGETLFGQVGGGAFRSYTVMGDTVNLASRLEHAARVGHILVGETTYALTRGAFHYTALPSMEIKGKREPVRAFEVVREKRADEILHQPAGTDYLIGREAELQRLRAALEEMGGGRGRLLAIVGDAGIGKSQLLAAFRRAGATAPSPAGEGEMESEPIWIVERCLSYEATAPYSLLSGLLRSLLDLDCEEELDRQKLLGALKATLEGSPGSFDDETRAEYLALLGQILGVQIANPYIAGLEAKVRRKLIGAMVRALAIARARPGGRPRPLVLVLEEMQWADSPSVDALDDLIDAIPGLPILLLLTYRPEWSHDWQARSFYDVIKLGELTPEQSRHFLRQQLPAAALPDAVADAIIVHCGNNPLLLEETAKSLQERRVLVPKKGEWTLTADVSLLNIPSTLRGIMMARMDRLSERDRAILQKAAIIGRTFTYAILATIVAPDGEERADASDGADALDDSLAALKAEEF
ncbi:MAG: Adenylate cyclase / Guanylate cyclase, partial [uncultured Thermomicrobiales bacterium]